MTAPQKTVCRTAPITDDDLAALLEAQLDTARKAISGHNNSPTLMQYLEAQNRENAPLLSGVPTVVKTTSWRPSFDEILSGKILER